jgi:hypothetical protein
MRRAICFCEPNISFAGNRSNWKFSYTTALNLPEGSRLRFDLLSDGRETDWEIPTVDPKGKGNLIWAVLPDKKIIYPTLIETEGALISSLFEFELPSEVKTGETLMIILGAPSEKREEQLEHGSRAQCYVQRRRPFHLFVDPKGKGDFRDPEIFTLDVKGNRLDRIRIISPSLVSKNQRFDVFLRFEDRYGNLTGNAPEGTLIELSYEQLRENLSWKLFVPETGFLNLPNLYFNEAGTYTIQLLNTHTKEKFTSSPIKCFDEVENSLYWGTLHSESEKIDAAENIEICLRHFRDEIALHFFGSSSFEAAEETSNEEWKSISQHVADFNEDTRFATFLGFQWIGEPKKEGIRQLIYQKDNKPILRYKDSKSNALKKIYKSHNPKDLISIPSFTMAKTMSYNFEDFTPEYERVVEIYNAWGSSECLEKEGNPRPIATEDSGVKETADGSIRSALNRGCRFGFVAGGLDDRGVYGDFYDSEQIQYSPGLTGILSPVHSREGLFNALYNRSCYATTGKRIVIGFSIAGMGIGSEISTEKKPGLILNRHIAGFVSGTDDIKEIAIIRNGEVFKTFSPHKRDFDFTFDDDAPLKQISFPEQNERPAFTYYYMRVEQVDGHIAWSSPIWIDCVDVQGVSSAAKKAKAPAKKK